MELHQRIAELEGNIQPAYGNDILEMQEDIYRYFSEIEGFDILKVEPTEDKLCRLKAVCQTTHSDPIFKLVVSNIWKSSLAFDEEWHDFKVTELGIVFEFLTWDDTYVSGRIWFERVSKSIS
jgi:hypothetical protein